MPVIRFESAGKSFGGKWAVRGLDLHVSSGEIVGLLGPNGAGKTTAIRMVTGLLRPTEGRVSIGGHDIIKEPEAAKSMTGYVPDSSYLYERLTGREFLSFIASIHGVQALPAEPRMDSLIEAGNKAENKAESRMDTLMDEMGIRDVEHDSISGYSHGMRQRLLFASALVHEPGALVIDEPFVGLDPYGVEDMTALLERLAREGTAIFLATHSLHIAQDLCHRAGVMYKGRLAGVLDRDEFGSGPGGLVQRFREITS